MRKVQIALSLLACGVGLALGAAALHPLAHDPLRLYAAMRSEKFHLMDTWTGRATSAAFGSSHVHNGFDPRTFDSQMATGGVALKSLNLGVEGGAQTEQRAMALRFLQTLPKGSHPAVLLELNAGANLTNDHLVHPRSINLYDLPTVRFATTLYEPGISSKRRELGRSGFAVAAWGLHLLNFGMISSRIFSPPLEEKELENESRDDRRGLLAPEVPSGITQKIQRFIAEQNAATVVSSKGEVDLGARLLAEELQQKSPVPGLQVVYFVMPRLDDISHHVSWPNSIATSGGPVPVLALNRPDRYPELYSNPALWSDDSHLSDGGAQLAGKYLADQWLMWQKQCQTNPNATCEAGH